MLRSFRTGTLFLTAALFGAACRQDPALAARRYVESGDRFSGSGKYAEAIIEYRNAVQQDARSGEAHARLADAFLKAGNPGSALGELVRAADLLPDDLQLQLRTGNLLLLAGRFDDARVRANRLLEKDARSIDAQILLANALAGLKDVDGALRQIEDARRVDPARSGVYSNLGMLELTRGQREAAERAFKKAIELEPRSLQAQLSIGNYYWLTGQATLAEESLQRALALDPINPLTNRALASFYLATNRPREAEQPLRALADGTKDETATLALADYYLATGNETRARATLEPLTAQPHPSSDAAVRVAALDDKGGQKQRAYAGVDAVLARDQANLQGLLLKSALLLADRKLDDALAIATTATERHPEASTAFYALGQVQASRRQAEAARAAFQEALRLNPRATDAKIALSQLNLSQGNAVASVAFAREAVSDDPASAAAQLALVRSLLANGDRERAETELKRLSALFPDSAAVHTQTGMLLAQKQDVGAARMHFERALLSDPRSIEALSGLVGLDLAKRDFKSAQAAVDARISVQPSAGVFTLGARAYAAAGDLSTAEKYLRRAIELDNRNLAAYGGLGQVYLAQNKLGQARGEFEALAVLEPKSVPAWTMIGVILQAQGDVKGAQSRFERVMEIDAEAAVAANNLAWIYAETGGNLDQALQLAQVAHKHLPDSAEVNDTLGFVYYRKNLASLGVEPLKTSTEKSPNNPVYHYHLGLAYARAGDATRARQALARALQLEPDFEGAREARGLLRSLSSD